MVIVVDTKDPKLKWRESSFWSDGGLIMGWYADVNKVDGSFDTYVYYRGMWKDHKWTS